MSDDTGGKVIVWPLERYQDLRQYGLGMIHLAIQKQKERDNYLLTQDKDKQDA